MSAILREGDLVDVRMQVVRIFDGSVTCCLVSDATGLTHYVPVSPGCVIRVVNEPRETSEIRLCPDGFSGSVSPQGR